VAARAHAGLGDNGASEEARRRALETIEPIVDSLPEGPLRDAYVARHDVAEVLSWRT
jgi:hypothetical protein